MAEYVRAANLDPRGFDSSRGTVVNRDNRIFSDNKSPLTMNALVVALTTFNSLPADRIAKAACRDIGLNPLYISWCDSVWSFLNVSFPAASINGIVREICSRYQNLQCLSLSSFP